MSRTSYATRIRLRIAELEQQIAAASSELTELRVAERVLGRFSGLENDDEGSAAPAQGVGKEPTISDQIMEILSQNGPLDTSMIFGRLNELRSSPASLATVQSTLSRVKASNKIGHDGTRWYVIKSGSPQSEPQTNKAPEGALSIFD
jgi:hypothetical protein